MGELGLNFLQSRVDIIGGRVAVNSEADLIRDPINAHPDIILEVRIVL